MLDTPAYYYALLGIFIIAVFVLWLPIYPKPYPEIPYNEASAKRISGDIPDLITAVQASNEFTDSAIAVTARKLGSPIAQILFPRIRKPLVVLNDAREIEDILLRRSKEFDKAPLTCELFKPIFPNSMVSRFSTPELKVHKRIWAEVMSVEFLRKTGAPKIYKATLELLELWRLKASTIYKDQPFEIYDDLKNEALDAIWVSLLGEEPGMTRFEIQSLQNQLSGKMTSNEKTPRGVFVREEVAYISDCIERFGKSVSPWWSWKFESLTSRYRKFRRTVDTELGRIIKNSVARYQQLEVGSLGVDDADTCAMDLVLRRQILQAKQAGSRLNGRDKDRDVIDELFAMMIAVSHATCVTRSS
jgi:hypothetical protein